MTRPKTRLCVDGPWADKKIAASLGVRWPFVLYYTDTEIALGYYEYHEATNTYHWWDQPAEITPRTQRGGPFSWPKN